MQPLTYHVFFFIYEAGKKRLAGDIVRQANTSDVTALRREARDLKEVVAEQTLELRLLKKNMLGDGDDLELRLE